MPGGRAGTPEASYERARREQESQEDIEATLDRQHLRTNHLTPRQRWVPHYTLILFLKLQNEYFQRLHISCVKIQPDCSQNNVKELAPEVLVFSWDAEEILLSRPGALLLTEYNQEG